MNTNPDARDQRHSAEPNPHSQASQRRHLLVLIDFSEASVRALRFAQNLAAGGKAWLTLVNAIEEPLSFRTLDLASLRRERRSKRLTQLMSFARKVLGAEVPVTAVVEDGSSAEVIARVAEHKGAEMIILARPERRQFWHWFSGSTAARLVHRVACPVITL